MPWQTTHKPTVRQYVKHKQQQAPGIPHKPHRPWDTFRTRRTAAHTWYSSPWKQPRPMLPYDPGKQRPTGRRLRAQRPQQPSREMPGQRKAPRRQTTANIMKKPAEGAHRCHHHRKQSPGSPRGIDKFSHRHPEGAHRRHHQDPPWGRKVYKYVKHLYPQNLDTEYLITTFRDFHHLPQTISKDNLGYNNRRSVTSPGHLHKDNE